MTNADKTAELKSRRDLSRLAGLGAFVLTYFIFVVSWDWGFVLGLIPALIAAAIITWISYRHFWLGLAFGALFYILGGLS